HGLQVGGAEVLAAALARRLGDRLRFVFICLDELGTLGEQLRSEGFPVHVLARRPGVDWRCIAGLGGLLRRERVDLVHAHQYTPFFYSLTARLLVRRLGIMFTEHGRHYPDYPRKKRIWINRLLLTRRDRVVGVGQAVRTALIDNEGIPQERIAVIYNGINIRSFQLRAEEREKVRWELGFSDHDFLIIQVARLDYLKDHATAIRTMVRVVHNCPTARLLLVGEGPELSKIQQQVRKSGLEKHIHLLGLRTDIARLLAAADMFLLTSISEGIPVTLLEAMAAGLPLVATRVGGVSEVIIDGETGLLAPAREDAQLAEHVVCLARQRETRIRFGKAGIKRAEDKFSEQEMHAGYLRSYQEMLNV
ncbi:MAG TPA: glycosyltransferase, partial [Gemmataceae bacterium]|nr:glycosyltransferase [Gemmataceae bacterium]